MHYPKFQYHRFTKDFVLSYYQALIIIHIPLEILVLIYEMRLVKDNFSSMITPKNFVKVTCSKEMLLKVTLMLLCINLGHMKNYIM